MRRRTGKSRRTFTYSHNLIFTYSLLFLTASSLHAQGNVDASRTGTIERTVQLTPGDLPSLNATRVSTFAGLQLITLTPEIRSERRLKGEGQYTLTSFYLRG